MSTFTSSIPGFTTTPEKGTIGYHAAIDRPERSKLSTCKTYYYPTRRAAVLACLERIAREGVRVKATDTITTHEWTATGTGGWQVEMMRILSGAEKVTLVTARDWQAAEPVLA